MNAVSTPMRAAVLTTEGRPRLDAFTRPRAAPGAVAIEVAAAGLNPVDVALAAGAFRVANRPLPRVVGEEGVGRMPDGRRVYFGSTLPPYGAMAPYALVDPEQLFDVPDGVDDATAVALGIAGLAGWLPIAWRAKVQPGETVLVLGATGAVGRVAVQAARLNGAGRVVAAGRDAAGLERATQLGADATVRVDQPDLTEAIRRAAEGHVDVVIDALWGSAAVSALDAGAPGVRLVQVGNAAALEAAVPASLPRMKDLTILGYSSFTNPVEVERAAYSTLLEHAAAGRIEVDVQIHPLADLETAWERQRSGTREKLVLVP
jgi:NADPH2:quinone reductase